MTAWPRYPQCIGHLTTVSALFQMGQCEQPDATASIGFFARELIKIVLLQLVMQRFLK